MDSHSELYKKRKRIFWYENFQTLKNRVSGPSEPILMTNNTNSTKFSVDLVN